MKYLGATSKLYQSYTFNDIMIILDKENVPEDVPKVMIYSPRKFKGHGLIKVSWEAALQHMDIMCQSLKQ